MPDASNFSEALFAAEGSTGSLELDPAVAFVELDRTYASAKG